MNRREVREVDAINFLRSEAAQNPGRIVFPEILDDRVIAAVKQLSELNIAHPILIGDHHNIPDALKKTGLPPNRIEYVSPRQSPWFDGYVAAYCEQRGNVTEKIARKMMSRPLFFGGMMVSQGHADGMVAGLTYTTSWVIRAAGLTIGLKTGVSDPSSWFIMIVPEFRGERDKIFIFADAAVSVKPTAEQLAKIAVRTARNSRRLFHMEPKVAMLSFSTRGSSQHAETEKVIKATQLAKEMAPDLLIDGELQVDAALIPEIAAKKVADSPVAGQANVLIFPDLNAANIGYKLVQYLAHARAIGPILQGFRKPVSDLSRGATIEDIIDTTAVTVILAQR